MTDHQCNADDCLVCQLEATSTTARVDPVAAEARRAELDRIAGFQRRDSVLHAEAYYVAPNGDNVQCLWRIGDPETPELVVRRDEFRDKAAWELLVVGVNVAQGLAVNAE